MNKERIETNKAPLIEVSHCAGYLAIRGWDETAVLCKGEAFTLTETEAGATVSSEGDLKLMAPHTATIAVRSTEGDFTVKYVHGSISVQEALSDAIFVGVGDLKLTHIHGDLTAKNLDSGLVVETVHGDAIVRNGQEANLGTVHGDVSARNLGGNLAVHEAHGDINLRTIDGDVTVQNGKRDVNLRTVGGRVLVKQADGDIRLRGGLNEAKHSFTAQGDIIVRWPSGVPIILEATAPTINNELPLEDLAETENTLSGRLADGSTVVSLTANGRIILKESGRTDQTWEFDDDASFDFDFDLDMEELGERIRTQMMDQFSRLSTDFERKFGPEFAEKVSRKAEKAAAKAERAAKRAAARAEKAAERARRRAEAQRTRRGPGRPPSPPRPPQPKRKASTEEQLKILKMVEQGIITPDEATTLLDAIED